MGRGSQKESYRSSASDISALLSHQRWMNPISCLYRGSIERRAAACSCGRWSPSPMESHRFFPPRLSTSMRSSHNKNTGSRDHLTQTCPLADLIRAKMKFPLISQPRRISRQPLSAWCKCLLYADVTRSVARSNKSINCMLN